MRHYSIHYSCHCHHQWGTIISTDTNDGVLILPLKMWCCSIMGVRPHTICHPLCLPPSKLGKGAWASKQGSSSQFSLHTPLWINPNLPHFFSIPDPQAWRKFHIKELSHMWTKVIQLLYLLYARDTLSHSPITSYIGHPPIPSAAIFLILRCASLGHLLRRLCGVTVQKLYVGPLQSPMLCYPWDVDSLE